MRVIRLLTGLYVVLVAALMIHDSEAGSKVGGVIFGEVLFSSPMLATWLIAEFLKHKRAQQVMLCCAIVYAVFSTVMYYDIITGQHDAQWQLAFLLIPMWGFGGVVLAGLVAAALRIAGALSR